jgi:hypothetical protein
MRENPATSHAIVHISTQLLFAPREIEKKNVLAERKMETCFSARNENEFKR